jgi:hypothetical protein
MSTSEKGRNLEESGENGRMGYWIIEAIFGYFPNAKRVNLVEYG